MKQNKLYPVPKDVEEAKTRVLAYIPSDQRNEVRGLLTALQNAVIQHTKQK